MLRALRRRLRQWIAARTPRVAGPWTLDRRRIYIVPTRYGYGYGLLLLTMLLGAMNYSNSMAFALTFLLAGVGLLAMHDTHANLLNLTLATRPAPPVFAGEPARFPVHIRNPSRRARFAITLASDDDGTEPAVEVDLPAVADVIVELTQPSLRRGWLPARRFAVSTAFPVGLFHAWTWVELDAAVLVYPAPAAAGPPPPPSGPGDGRLDSARPGIDVFAGLRGYRPGDPLRAIDWKGVARQAGMPAPPQVRQFADPAAGTQWLDWQALPATASPEQRLSLLARWVLDADRTGRHYGLRLPRTVIAPGAGETHRHACLTALALF